MGLDMYLKGKKSFYDKKYKSEKERDIHRKIRKIIPEIYKSGNLNSIEISFEAGYWRKANQIHQWFVDNVQDGEDDCGEYWVSRERLKELKNLCKEVKNDISKGKELLPTQSGFFFGNTNYDDYYLQEIKRTIKIIENTLTLPKGWDFYYQSSW